MSTVVELFTGAQARKDAAQRRTMSAIQAQQQQRVNRGQAEEARVAGSRRRLLDARREGRAQGPVTQATMG